MFVSRYILKMNNGKSFEFPLKWLVKWVELNTDYESTYLFAQKASLNEHKKAVRAAQQEGIGNYVL